MFKGELYELCTLSFYIVYKSNQIGHLENSVLLVTSLPNLFLHVIFSNLTICAFSISKLK